MSSDGARTLGTPLKLVNCQIVDIPAASGVHIKVRLGTIFVEDGLVQGVEYARTTVPPAGTHRMDAETADAAKWMTVDIGGAYVLPGLCDAHVHVTAVTADLKAIASLPPSLIIARSSIILREMLFRGFTTVRDAGGCDWVSTCCVGPDILDAIALEEYSAPEAD